MWDERYSTEEYLYGTKPNDFIAEATRGLPPGAALCLGAGEGRNAVYLAELGHTVTAVDLSQVGLDKAQRLAETRGVKLNCVKADLASYELEPNRWDLIVTTFCHLPPAVRDHAFAQLPGALRPGGRYVMEGYTVEQLQLKTGGPPHAEWMFDAEMMRAYLKGLEIERCEALRRPVREGRLHTGEAAVLQLIAKRPA